MLILWPKNKVATPEYDYVTIISSISSPINVPRQPLLWLVVYVLLSSIQAHCSSKLILSSRLHLLMLLLFMLQHMHTNLSLFSTALNNTCPSTPIAGHNAILPSFLLQVEQFSHPTPVVLVPLVCCLHSSHYCANMSVLSQTPHLLSNSFTEHSLFTNYLSNYSSHQGEYFPSLCCPAFSPLVFTDIILLFLHTDIVVNQVSPTFHLFNLQVLLITSG